MSMLALKLVLTPLLIAAATLTARKWGPAVGGWLAGLPLTSGPVSVFLALEQGERFAAQSAVGTLLGLLGVAAFCVGYARCAARQDWPVSVVVGVTAFVLVGLLVGSLALSTGWTFAAVCSCLVVALGLVPKQESPRPSHGAPRWDLPLRMIAATGMVLLITAVARPIGPRFSGVLSPFPVFAGIMAVFAHRAHGAEAARQLLRGVLVGSFAFASFFLVVALTATQLPLWSVYASATAIALGVNGVLLIQLVRRG